MRKMFESSGYDYMGFAGNGGNVSKEVNIYS
jgi:hypothetical protein